MDREEALTLLPFVYATALRLEEQGVAAAVIARAVGVVPEAVPNLMQIAHHKLIELTEANQP